ncbi:SDR family NAD(P)-dependent oxidoreductase [Actinomadura sp. B10D3]|uniref:SDR family NAD(P)-dependent oxidoreductase n=1 Tax=Actinomadura sp. B10D3 TaxID=3153557 RepID=UPI00325F0B32
MAETGGGLAVVTGGAGGIGLRACRELARRGFGVLVADVHADGVEAAVAELRSDGFTAEGRTLDVTSRESVDALMEAVAAQGPLTALVTCAGIVHTGSIDDCTDDAWARVIEVNLTGTMRVCRAALPHFSPGGGTITTVASISGRTASTFSSPAYVASKAGVIGLTMSLAGQLAARGIRVNSVAPGIIETPMTDTFGDERLGLLRGKIPLGRLGSADEVARAIAFLAGPESSFVTGHTMDVNGGQFISG